MPAAGSSVTTPGSAKPKGRRSRETSTSSTSRTCARTTSTGV